MAEPVPLEAPRGEPLSIFESPPGPGSPWADAADAGGVPRQIEFSCRGDRVPLTLVSPASGGPHPVLLLQPAPGGTEGPPGLRPWLESGVAVASIELPLFGSRRSAKLSQRLVETVVAATRGDEVDEPAVLLWEEFTRQSVLELRRVPDVLAEVGAAPRAIAFAGVGIAASVGALLCATDERIAGGVLALTGGGFGPASIDPASFVPSVAPRPLLLVSQESARARPGAPAIPRERAVELHEAARDPVEVCWQSPEEPDVLAPALRFLGPLLGSAC